MTTDLNDTIAAIASATGGAARGVIRISGPDALEAAARYFVASGPPPRNAGVAHRRSGDFQVAFPGRPMPLGVPCQLFVWPTTQSYTRQPSVELHTLGSPPLLEAILRQLCAGEVRLARPGEFTLRSFLAGRIDLTQAEAVLGVIDAGSEASLQTALQQLAGGLSTPLKELRERLLLLLAELEAGLDFADEPLELVSRETLAAAVRDAQDAVAAARRQIDDRTAESTARRVVLTGPPNAGKSSLFNALVQRYATGQPRVLVSPVAGTTRDYVEAELQLGELRVMLVDTPGADESTHASEPAAHVAAAASSDTHPDAPWLARQIADNQAARAQLRIVCHPGGEPSPPTPAGARQIVVATKSDLVDQSRLPPDSWPCSSLTGAGIEPLADEIARRAADDDGHVDAAASGVLSVRCAACLERAREPLAAAASLIEAGNQEELVAAELRVALDALGELVGAVYADDVLDRIFSKFCIGK